MTALQQAQPLVLETEDPSEIHKLPPKTVVPLNTEYLKINTNKFNEVITKIYDRSFDLGECFKRNIEFETFETGKLRWLSSAEGEDKKQLRIHWGVINMFVKEVFGLDTKIDNVAKKKVVDTSIESATTSTSSVPDTLRHTNESPVTEPVKSSPTHQDADIGSMIEDIEMRSSCIAPDAGDTEVAKEKDPSTLLDEPMIKEAIALFNPKKVRIKKNV